jgi:hypothetical protein
MNKWLLILLLLFSFNYSSYATTWDEPWAEEVIKQASSFVFAKVIYNDETRGIKIQVIRTLGGRVLNDSLKISNFYDLNICSSSGHRAEFYLPAGADSCYFFIKKNSKGEYCIATPTAGVDYLSKGKVVAIFRHSYHAAQVPIIVYEKMMTAVFNNYHGEPYDREYVNTYVNTRINGKPAGFADDEINTF